MANKNPRLPKKPGIYCVFCLDTYVFKSQRLIIKYLGMQFQSLTGVFQVPDSFRKVKSCCNLQKL